MSFLASCDQTWHWAGSKLILIINPPSMFVAQPEPLDRLDCCAPYDHPGHDCLYESCYHTRNMGCLYFIISSKDQSNMSRRWKWWVISHHTVMAQLDRPLLFCYDETVLFKLGNWGDPMPWCKCCCRRRVGGCHSHPAGRWWTLGRLSREVCTPDGSGSWRRSRRWHLWPWLISWYTEIHRDNNRQCHNCKRSIDHCHQV